MAGVLFLAAISGYQNEKLKANYAQRCQSSFSSSEIFLRRNAKMQ